jgi:hypothetical protein
VRDIFDPAEREATAALERATTANELVRVGGDSNIEAPGRVLDVRNG